MPQVNFVLEAETAQAVQGILKVMDATKKTSAETQKWKSAADELLGPIQKVAGYLGVGIGIHSAVSGIVSGMQRWADLSDEIADKIKGMKNDMMALAIMQDPGKRVGMMNTAGDLAIKFGSTVQQAMNAVQTAQSMPGKNDKTALEAAGQLLQGGKMGMDPDALSKFMNSTSRRGMSDEWSTFLPFAAGRASYRTPEEMVKASEALQKWDDPILMMAASPEVMSATNPEIFATYLKQAGGALHDPDKKSVAAWKKLGIKFSDSEAKKIEALAKAGLDQPWELEKAGITKEERATGGLAAIVQGWQKVKENNAAWRKEYHPGIMQEYVASVEGEVPQIGLAAKQQQAESKAEVDTTLGNVGIQTQAFKVAQLNAGAWLRKKMPQWALPFTTDDGMKRPGGLLAPLRLFESMGGLMFGPSIERGRLLDLGRSGAASDTQRAGLARMAVTELRARGEAAPPELTSYMQNSFQGQTAPPSDDLLKRVVAILESIDAKTASTTTTQRRATPVNMSVQTE